MNKKSLLWPNLCSAMLCAMLIQQIPFEEIDLENEKFRISEELDSMPLLDSLREVGQLNPLVLLEQNSRRAIVCGFRRVRAMQKLGMTGALARILPRECDPAEAFLVALWDNLSHRQMAPLEKARIIFKLKANFDLPDETLIHNYLPILGLDPAENVLRAYLLLHEIDPDLRRCFAEGWLTSTSIEQAAKMPYPAQNSIASIMGKIRLSASLQKRFFGLLLDLAATSGDQPDAPISSQEVRAITNDSRLSAFQRGERVCEVLYGMRNPRLSQAQNRFLALKKQLGLPGPIRITPHPYFEEPGLHFEFEAVDAQQLRALAAALSEVAHTPEMSELFIVK